MSRMRHLLLLSGLLAILPTAPRTMADESSEADLKGIYAPLELRRREPNDLIDTSAQYRDMFERRSLLYNDSAVLGLVRRVGSALTPAPTDDYIDYEFYVIRDPSPNAFAFPNGQIFVHTGMLARMRDESQLAALLAHEINHVAGHHSILSYRITAKRFLIQVVSGGLGSVLGQLRYSRQLEQEADDRAVLLMQDTAYDPHALTELLEILGQDIEGLDPRYATIWTTHPDPEVRIEASRRNLAAYAGKARDADAYDAVVYSLRSITVRDYIQDDYPYTAMAVAESFIERYPGDLDFRLALGDAQRLLGPRPPALPEDFSKGDARRKLMNRVRNSRGQRTELLLESAEGQANLASNLERAMATYDEILDIDPGYWAAYRGIGDVYLDQGNDRDAARAYLTYVSESPTAPDRPAVIARLTEIHHRLTEEESND